MNRHIYSLIATLAVAHLLTGCPAEVAGEIGDGAGTQQVQVVSEAVIDSRLCDFIANFANGDFNDEVLAAVDDGLGGTRLPVVQDRNYLEITGVRSISFTACRLRMRVGLHLHREGIRRNGDGYADIKGTLFAARQWKQVPNANDPNQLIWSLRKLACVRNVQTENITLSHTTNVFEAFAELVADRVAKTRCFEGYDLWTQVEQGIALNNALIDIFAPGQPKLPALTYEML